MKSEDVKTCLAIDLVQLGAHLGENGVLDLDSGLLGSLDGRDGEVSGLVVLRRLGEVGVLVLLGGELDSGLRRGRASTANQLLSLGGVVAHILLGDLSSLGSALLGGVTELLGLGVDNLAGVMELVVNDFLVVLVDKRGEEGDSGADQGKTPVGDNLDKIVSEECSKGSLRVCKC